MKDRGCGSRSPTKIRLLCSQWTYCACNTFITLDMSTASSQNCDEMVRTWEGKENTSDIRGSTLQTGLKSTFTSSYIYQHALNFSCQRCGCNSWLASRDSSCCCSRARLVRRPRRMNRRLTSLAVRIRPRPASRENQCKNLPGKFRR